MREKFYIGFLEYYMNLEFYFKEGNSLEFRYLRILMY